MEKNTEQIKLMVSLELKDDLQDLAMMDDRSVSDWIRVLCKREVRLRKHGIRIEIPDLHGMDPEST